MTQDLLDIYTDFLIAQSQYATATSLSNLLEGSISHDRFTRFLNKNTFNAKDLWQYVKPKVRQQELEQGGVLIIDDAIEEKPGSKDNMEYIHHELGKKFIFGLKANRLAALSEEARKKGQYQNLNTLDIKDGEVRKLWLKDLSLPVSLIKRVFKNEDGSSGTLYPVTNDLESSPDGIYDIYQKRWRVEEYHKSIKQNSSLEKSPTRTENSQKNHLFASLIGYCKL